MYYALIMLSVVMFGGCFGLQDLFRRKRGSGIRISMESACVGAVAGLLVLIVINGFALEFSPFTLLMATVSAINTMVFAFCAFRALDHINLSLFSVFSMLGGMILPFFQGIFFYGEGVTLAKGICVLFIIAALAFTVEKGEKKRGTIFYIGIFVLNGMAGVIAKIYTATDLPKASAAGYSMWCAAMTALLSGTAWLLLSLSERKRSRDKDTEIIKAERKAVLQSYGIGALNGSINTVANFLLILALANVEASVQYPMVTGGTMIVSTVISCFGDKKPNKREIASVALAFLGMLALFVIPV